MKLHARKDVVIRRASSPHSDAEWDRWFAWYSVTVATSQNSAHRVWLEFVEWKWSASLYGTKRRRYRLPHNSKLDVRRRFHNLKKLTQKLDGALSQPKSSNRLR
jgi:hypothetical protein